MENISNQKTEKNVYKNPKAFVPSKNLTYLKRKLSLPFRLHSLICECVIFISIGSIIAISGNFATIVFYNQSTSPQSSNLTKDIRYDENRANHSFDFEFHQNDDNVTYSRKVFMQKEFIHIDIIPIFRRKSLCIDSSILNFLEYITEHKK